MFNFCPNTFCGLGSHSYTEWERVTTQRLTGVVVVWWKRRCKRCADTEYKKTQHRP